MCISKKQGRKNVPCELHYDSPAYYGIIIFMHLRESNIYSCRWLWWTLFVHYFKLFSSVTSRNESCFINWGEIFTIYDNSYCCLLNSADTSTNNLLLWPMFTLYIFVHFFKFGIFFNPIFCLQVCFLEFTGTVHWTEFDTTAVNTCMWQMKYTEHILWVEVSHITSGSILYVAELNIQYSSLKCNGVER